MRPSMSAGEADFWRKLIWVTLWSGEEVGGRDAAHGNDPRSHAGGVEAGWATVHEVPMILVTVRPIPRRVIHAG